MQIIFFLVLSFIGGMLEIALVFALAVHFDAWGIASLYFAMRIARVCAEIAKEV